MESGHVYVMVNDSMPGIVKIGFTSRSPADRAKELWTTGVPSPFVVVFSMFCDDDDMKRIEATIHEALRDKRVNQSREFFRIDWRCAAIRIANEFFGCYAHGVASLNRIVSQEFIKSASDSLRCPECDVVDVLMFVSEEALVTAEALLLSSAERLDELAEETDHEFGD